MTDFEALGFDANIARLQAKRTLEKLRFSNVRVSAFYIRALVLTATRSEQQAERAFIAYRRAELRAGLMPS